MAFHKDLNFTGSHGNKGAKRERIEKVCTICGAIYIGVRASRLCSKRECKQASNREWQKRNMASISEKRKAKLPVDNRDYSEREIPSTVKKNGHCNHCDKKFTGLSKYAQYCPECIRTKAYEEKYINTPISVDLDELIEINISEPDPLMSIIENKYTSLTIDEQEAVYDMVYREMIKRYGKNVFKEITYENEESNLPSIT